tara:strand:+ start:98 stop:328 length:231 start_codon:yes stop_codon:yes gene_type:complete
MKRIFLVFILIISYSSNIYAEQKCRDLPGFKKIGKDSAEYIECLAKKAKEELTGEGKIKLNTDSKLTDWIKKKLEK